MIYLMKTCSTAGFGGQVGAIFRPVTTLSLSIKSQKHQWNKLEMEGNLIVKSKALVTVGVPSKQGKKATSKAYR